MTDRAGRGDTIQVAAVLLGRLGWEQRAALDERAPTHLAVPSGSRVPVDYSDPAAPVLAARLQELFGWTDTPCIGGGRVPLTIHLLSPAHRPSGWRSCASPHSRTGRSCTCVSGR